MENLKNLGKRLSRTAQKTINGGSLGGCHVIGCFSFFIGNRSEGSPCEIAAPAGFDCFGTVVNNQCCIG